MVVEDGQPFGDSTSGGNGDVSITSTENEESDEGPVIQVDTNELLNLAVTSIVGGVLATAAKKRMEDNN